MPDLYSAMPKRRLHPDWYNIKIDASILDCKMAILENAIPDYYNV
jgi:hypothetical protein